jgi:hypothetical protein
MKTTNETSHCPFIMPSDTRLHAVCQSVQDRCSTINTRCFHDRHRKAHGTKGTAGGRIKLMGPVIPALGCTNVNSITNQRQEPLRGRVSRACGCEPDTTCSRRGPVTGSYKHTLIMEAVSSSSVNIYQTTWTTSQMTACHLHTRRRENLKSPHTGYCYGVVSYKASHAMRLFSDLLCVPI